MNRPRRSAHFLIERPGHQAVPEPLRRAARNPRPRIRPKPISKRASLGVLAKDRRKHRRKLVELPTGDSILDDRGVQFP
jgi:hypothetical protein